MRMRAHAILNPPELRGSAHRATIRKKRTVDASIAPRTRIARTYNAITIERGRSPTPTPSPIADEAQEVREDRESTHEPAPARALDGGRGRVELLDEDVDRAPVLLDGRLEGAGIDRPTVALALRLGGREVLPEEGVVDVTCARPQRADWSSRRATWMLEKFTHHRR